MPIKCAADPLTKNPFRKDGEDSKEQTNGNNFTIGSPRL